MATQRSQHVRLDEEVHPTQADFEELYAVYYPRLYAYVYGRVRDMDDAADIVDAVFERALRSWPAFAETEPFGPHVLAIARHLIASHLRKRKREHAPQSEPVSRLPEDAITSPERAILAREDIQSVVAQLRRLSRREQEIISLKFDAELSDRDIAQILNMSEVNVRVTLQRGLHRLREEMERERTPKKPRFESLRGLWKGKTKFTYRDVESAKFQVRGVPLS
jgi:RNA polymerase sigma factor (sigma-70 family)